MKREREDQNLRLRDLVKQEKAKIMKKEERARQAGPVTADVPALFNQFRDKDWARRLKEKIKSWDL
jgi:hypothetical protein